MKFTAFTSEAATQLANSMEGQPIFSESGEPIGRIASASVVQQGDGSAVIGSIAVSLDVDAGEFKKYSAPEPGIRIRKQE